MSGFELTPEQVSLRELAAEVAREVYAPMARSGTPTAPRLPDDEVKRLAELGFLGIALPEEYGGHGGTADRRPGRHRGAGQGVPARRRSRCSRPTPARPRSSSFLGTEQQKRRTCPRSSRARATMAIGISEPDAGSAATDMTHPGQARRRRLRRSTAPSAGSPTAATPTTTCVYARLSATSQAPRASARSSSTRTRRASASAPRRSSWASAASPPPTSSSTTSGAGGEPRHRRPAASASCSACSPSSGSATRR